MRKFIATAALTATLLGSASLAASPVLADEDAPADDTVTQVTDALPRVTQRAAATYMVTKGAEVIGIEASALADELRSGRTGAQVAAEYGVDTDDIVDAIVGPLDDRIDVAVENGRLSEDRAEDLEERLESAVTDIVNGDYSLLRRLPR